MALVTDEEWANFHHHFVDVTTGLDGDNSSVMAHPEERRHQAEFTKSKRSFQPSGTTSSFATAASSLHQQLEFLQQDGNYAPDEQSRDTILATVPTRGYNANIPTFEMFSHAALSAAAGWAAHETGAE